MTDQGRRGEAAEKRPKIAPLSLPLYFISIMYENPREDMPPAADAHVTDSEQNGSYETSASLMIENML